jgi:hypothetical protein
MKAKSIICFCLVATLCIGLFGAPSPGVAEETDDSSRPTAIAVSLVLKVVHPQTVRDELIKQCGDLGGFPVLITNNSLVLKVPRKNLNAMVEFSSQKGWLLDKKIAREDLHRKIIDLKGRIESKEEVLGRLRKFFEDSDATATIDIEKKMTQIIETLEALKGQLRVALERARYGVLSIDFQFRRKENIVYTRSPFNWINSVDLDTFLMEF